MNYNSVAYTSFFYTKGQRGSVKLNYDGHCYVKFMENSRGKKWICATRSTTKCRARIRITNDNCLEILHGTHNHDKSKRAPKDRSRDRMRCKVKAKK
ncbi:uncharacterized protein Dwil_GK26933 [Drosophila willistoni]|uniref:FLYWCH-type domain-containing protein n=1 Tax=Drosophila willistoni TaxID=7260 RepID=A0A0Q9WW25_DROWI|nr:uncharacterized protein Dwil_GK26933 [Drosophila willistoni]